jgi:hypothetical protein
MAETAYLAERRERRWNQQRSQERYLVVSMFGFFFIAMMITNDQRRIHRYQSVRSDLDELKHRLDEAIGENRKQSTRRQLKPIANALDIHNLVCSRWDTNIDNWWQAHPDWEPHMENETHTCFRQIQDSRRAEFLREVYRNQYHGKECSEMKTRDNIGVGYAAAVVSKRYSFFAVNST